MEFFGVVFIVATTLILLFKKESSEQGTNDNDPNSLENNLSITLMFKFLYKIVKLEPVQKLLIILFTCRIAFATHYVRSLKLIEVGVPKESLGILNAQFQIVQLITPIVLGKFLDLNKPLDFFFKIYPIR
jgi:PAT family acetyl-CoA transporter-like MFS transporter 1